MVYIIYKFLFIVTWLKASISNKLDKEFTADPWQIVTTPFTPTSPGIFTAKCKATSAGNSWLTINVDNVTTQSCIVPVNGWEGYAAVTVAKGCYIHITSANMTDMVYRFKPFK